MNYLTRKIDGYFAGVGHKLYTWMVGYSTADKLNMPFAYSSFPKETDKEFHKYENWEEFFSLGNNEIWVNDLLEQGYEYYQLPLFDVNNEIEVNSIKNLIETNKKQKIIYNLHDNNVWCAPYDKYGDVLREKYYASSYRNILKPSYSTKYLNVAIHIRRGDAFDQDIKDKLSNIKYFTKIMDKIIELNYHTKPIMFHIYSENNIEDLNVFRKYDNININLNNNMLQIFTDIVSADIFITSNSGLSIQTGFINSKIKISNASIDENWIYCNDLSNFNVEYYQNLINKFNL
jgi:hypothetical protein